MEVFLLAGAVTGFAIGLTGVGGGAMMTPFLLMLGVPLHTAGSLPATLLGSRLTRTVPESPLRSGMAAILLALGIKLVLF